MSVSSRGYVRRRAHTTLLQVLYEVDASGHTLDDSLQWVTEQARLGEEGIQDFLEPAFYFSPALGDDPVGLVRQCLDGDPRFLLLAKPGEQGSYNYVDDRWLSQAIENGARGAYWDIIRKSRLARQGN